METFQPGDLITFRLHGDSYGLARVLHVHNFAIGEQYHLEILDAILTAENEGADSYGVPYERSHVLDGAENAPVVLDHIALTREAFSESSPAKVGHSPLDDASLEGYRLWLHVKRNEMIKRGQISDDEELEDEDEIDDQLDELEEGIDDEELGEDEDGEEPAGFEDEEAAESDPVLREVVARAWHAGEYHRPLSELLFEPNFREELSSPELEGTTIARYINSFFDQNNTEQINEMVSRFAEGDYSAGHELMPFGAAAADALGALLRGSIREQLAEDVINILCDMGNMRAYEHVARFFGDHEPNAADPLAPVAARGYCYAVMLTGGTPEPLGEYLGRLGDIAAAFPELAHDVASARAAVATMAPQEVDEPKGASNAPFGTL